MSSKQRIFIIVPPVLIAVMYPIFHLLAGLFTDKPLQSKIGMTGEATLRGRVLPVGGIKMKVLAAHRAGLAKVILPQRNEKDLDDLPEDIRQYMEIVLVDKIDAVFEEAFGKSDLKNHP